MALYITHYANDDLTNDCIAAWLDQTDDIVVIDNGSPRPFAPEYAVNVVRLPQNLPLVPANNAGMQIHPSSFMFNINNDVFPAPGCYDRMIAVFDNPEIGIAAPGTSDDCAGVLCISEYDSERIDRVVDSVDNHAWAFTQDVVDEIGWPDAEGHPHRACWYANKLWAWKARQAGYKVLAARSAYVEHRRAKGYDAQAHYAGQAWLEARMGERIQEAG